MTAGATAWARLAGALGMAHPIIQAPMGGGPTTPALVAAVSNAGGLGSVAGGYLAPAELTAEIAAVRRLTDRPFAVNLFVGGETVGASDPAPMLALLARWHDALGIAPPDAPVLPTWALNEQVDVLDDARVAAVSFTFGIPAPAVIRRLRRGGALLMGTATTVREALLLARAGCDAVVAQGAEAGAHRGTFAAAFEHALIGTMALVPQVADAVDAPVIAAGGIMDGRGIVAAQALGAAAVQMGTAFLVATEAGTSPAHRQSILAAGDDDTAITRAFSGRPARGVRNAFMDDVERGAVPIPGYPLQHHLTRALRAASAQAEWPDALSLWAGQGAGLARAGGAGELVARWVEQAAAVSASVPLAPAPRCRRTFRQ